MVKTKEEKTFVLIKPDAVRKGLIGEMIRRFEQRDLKIVALEMFQPTLDQMDNHYPKSEEWIEKLGNKSLSTFNKYNIDPKTVHSDSNPITIGKDVRAWLINYMTSAPLVKIVVQGVHAVDMVRKIVGPTIPSVAEMGTIRGDFSADSPILANVEKRAVMNLVHASDSPEEAEREISHWFSAFEAFDYKRFGVDE